jgi:transposase
MEETRRGGIQQDEIEGFPVLRTNVAGIDLGSESHWVCAPTVDGTGREVQEFAATTPELEKMAAWLKERKVVSVAMESTGVYWIPPQEVLERHGLEVVLVDARELARVPGRRKTDRLDCKWIQRLHSCGLLRGSFRPKEQINMLRTLVRDKGTLVAERADWIRRMQKSLDQMNVRVHRAVSDLARGQDGDVHHPGDPSGGAGCRRISQVARPALPAKRGANRRTIERALARGPSVQLGASP